MQNLEIHKTGVLWYWTRAPYTVVLDQANLEIDMENILVIHKKNPKIVATNTIWDWFLVPIFAQRWVENYELEKNFCTQWIMSYHSFDEIQNKNIHYAYKYPKIELEDLNEVFQIWELDILAELEGQHISLTSGSFEWEQDIKNHRQLFSFLFGMSLIYGDFHTVGDDILTHVRIDYPLIDSFLDITQRLNTQKASCEQDSLFWTIQTKEWKWWQQVQIDISDPEILSIYAQWLEIKSLETDISILKTYIQENQPKMIPLLSNSVLKLIKK